MSEIHMQLFDSFLSAHPYVLLLVIVWTLLWKGVRSLEVGAKK